MTVEKKLMIIAGVSVGLSVMGFLTDSDSPSSGLFTGIFEIFVLAFVLFIFIALNFFALQFCFKRIRQLFKNRK